MKRPVFALDVDGVTLPLEPPDHLGPAPAGYSDRCINGFDVWVADHVPEMLSGLAEIYEIVWCTDWLDNANEHLSPALGLPEFPVLRAPTSAASTWWKLTAVSSYATGRPLAWADDQLTAAARRWARARLEPTLLVRPQPRLGLTVKQLHRVRGFGVSH